MTQSDLKGHSDPLMNRVLITGATGFIGRHCLPLLSARGYEVHAVSSREPEGIRSGVHWHQTDLLDSRQTSKLIAVVQATHILHFAWYLVPGKYAQARENFQWVQSGLELLRQFYDCGGKRVVVAGSCFEYDWNYGYCSESRTPTEPNTVYGTCKKALQILLDAYSTETELGSAWGRLFFVYGPYEHPARLVSSVILSLLRGEPARCTDGTQIRDYLHVQDVAGAFVALLDSDVKGPVNIASGRPIALKHLVSQIADKLGRQELLQLGAVTTSANESPFVVADTGRLSEEVGWRPSYNLDRGLQQTISWWKGRMKSGKLTEA